MKDLVSSLSPKTGYPDSVWSPPYSNFEAEDLYYMELFWTSVSLICVEIFIVLSIKIKFFLCGCDDI